jgi:hypothetical protein
LGNRTTESWQFSECIAEFHGDGRPLEQFAYRLLRLDFHLRVGYLGAITWSFLRILAKRQLADACKNPFRGLALPAKGPAIVPFLFFAALRCLRKGFLLRAGFDEDDILPDSSLALTAILPLSRT